MHVSCDGFKASLCICVHAKKKDERRQSTDVSVSFSLKDLSFKIGETFEDLTAPSALSGWHLIGVSFPQELKSHMRENSKEEYTHKHNHTHTQNQIYSQNSGDKKNKKTNVHSQRMCQFDSLSLAFKIKNKV